ncbi:hypothetical protein AB0H71_01910 [Nocardia sp. NPDC050697]|uniref:hypothetical protein n=1 Tax=Nocardia sp. NPDC050697 TaxID=3155158 RepID=UPI0033CBCEB8
MTSNYVPDLFSHAPAAEQTEQQPDTGAVPTPVFSNPSSAQPRDTEPTPSRRPRR